MGFSDKYSLNIPFPNWARDDPDQPELDAENWKELQRWADRFNREVITIGSPSTSLTVETSPEVPVRFGGEKVEAVIQFPSLTTAGEIDLIHNGTVFATETLTTATTQLRVGPYDEPFLPLDTVGWDLTDAGSADDGVLIVSFWI